MISTIACDRENLGVITDYDVVSHLAHLTHKVRLFTPAQYFLGIPEGKSHWDPKVYQEEVILENI